MNILKQDTTGQIEIKKSKFIYYGYIINSKKEAEDKIKDMQKKYHDSKHVVFAYRVLEDDNLFEKMTEDGEPQGTAGTPILNILKKQDIQNVLIVVIRYFGGILLGTGGLVSAYSSCCKNCIENNIKIAKKLNRYVFEVDYKELKNLKHFLDSNAIVFNILYDINVLVDFAIEDVSILDSISTIKKTNKGTVIV